MNEKVQRSVIINIPKPRIYSNLHIYKSKKTKRITNNTMRKPSEASISKYTLHSSGPLPIQSIKREELFLSYKLYAKKQERKNHKIRLSIDIYDKYKVAYTDLRNRLNVEDPEDDVHAITDIDKDFYRCVETHKLSRYVPLFKSLNNLYDKYIRLRQEIGYINDYRLNIDVLQKKEREIYDHSVKRYMEQVKYLDEFISHDYKKSIACLNEYDNLANEVNIKRIELQTLATQQFTVVSRLIVVDYLYSLQQKYGRFLYYLSSPSWRVSHRDFARSVEIEARGFDFNCSNDEDTFNVIFDKMKNECYSGLIKPVLYFKRPSDLMNIFDGIEKQQLYHFSHVTRVEPHTKSLRLSINALKDKVKQETFVVHNTIKQFNQYLKYYNDRCSHLETKFYKILYGTFYETVATADVLKLKFHLEFGFEQVYFEKPFKIDIMTIAKALEKMYMDFSKKLDVIHSDKVKLSMANCIEMERKKIRRAKTAARELLVFERLQRDLLRAHGFVRVETTKFNEITANKSYDTCKKSRRNYSKTKSYNNKKILTEAEREYLSLFTDWTENDDPAEYLQSFSILQEEHENV